MHLYIYLSIDESRYPIGYKYINLVSKYIEYLFIHQKYPKNQNEKKTKPQRKTGVFVVIIQLRKHVSHVLYICNVEKGIER